MTTTRSDGPIVGVGGVAIENDRILLVQRRNEPRQGYWAVPGGKVQPGETMRSAVGREVKEETGLDVEVGDLVWVGEVIEDDTHLILIDFLVIVVGGELMPGDDAGDAAWVSLSALDQYPLTPTMHDLLDTLGL